MITDNCKFYGQSEKDGPNSVERVRPLSEFATSAVDADCSFYVDFTIEPECEAITADRYVYEELFATEAERQFNEQCRKDLHRWFRENEPYINDLARDIVAASRTNFKVFKR